MRRLLTVLVVSLSFALLSAQARTTLDIYLVDVIARATDEQPTCWRAFGLGAHSPSSRQQGSQPNRPGARPRNPRPHRTPRAE